MEKIYEKCIKKKSTLGVQQRIAKKIIEPDDELVDRATCNKSIKGIATRRPVLPVQVNNAGIGIDKAKQWVNGGSGGAVGN
jgi:hypothetical protein